MCREWGVVYGEYPPHHDRANCMACVGSGEWCMVSTLPSTTMRTVWRVFGGVCDGVYVVL
jgi:hypothetical protein